MSDKLGEGTYGVVKRVDDKTAVKISRPELDMNGRPFMIFPTPEIIKEIAILKKLRGTKNCGYLLKYELTPNEAKAYIPLGDINLHQYIKNNQNITVEEQLRIINDVGNGLKEMHERDIIHLDLKPNNIVRIDGVWKIVDFGLSFFGSCFLEESYSDYNLVTVDYRPPEIKTDGKVSPKVDIYSLGLIFLHIATKGRYLDKVYQPEYSEQLDFIDTIININEHSPRHQLGNEFTQLVKSMVSRDPSKRPDIETVLLDGSINIDSTESPRIPQCSTIIKDNIKVTPKPKEVPKTAVLHAYYKFSNTYDRRYASFFYVLQLASMYDLKIDKVLDYLASSVNSESVILGTGATLEIIELLDKLDFDILIHTPYSLLFSVVGMNDQAIYMLYAMALMYTRRYLEADPNKLVSAIADYINGNPHRAAKILMSVGMDLHNLLTFVPANPANHKDSRRQPEFHGPLPSAVSNQGTRDNDNNGSRDIDDLIDARR